MNNKGFAITSILYSVLVLFLFVLLSFLMVISVRRRFLASTLESANVIISNRQTVLINKYLETNTDSYTTIYSGKYYILASGYSGYVYLPKGTLIEYYVYNGISQIRLNSSNYVNLSSNNNSIYRFTGVVENNYISPDKIKIVSVNIDIENVTATSVLVSSGNMVQDNTNEENYRYSGVNVNNYVNFNCNGTVCEKWRIIGIFEVKNDSGIIESRVKLINPISIGTRAWDTDINDWTNADLKTYLNTTYYNSLSASAKIQISDAVWYLGGLSTTDIVPKQSYVLEHEISNPTVAASIGMISPSDYGYSKDPIYFEIKLNNTNTNQRNSSWIYNAILNSWTLTSSIVYNAKAFYYNKDVGNIQDASITTTYNVYPVLYLNPNVLIIAGDGSIDNPYVLG